MVDGAGILTLFLRSDDFSCTFSLFSIGFRFTVLALVEVCYRALSFENSRAEGTAVLIDLAVPGALPETEDISDLFDGRRAALKTFPELLLKAVLFFGVTLSSIS